MIREESTHTEYTQSTHEESTHNVGSNTRWVLHSHTRTRKLHSTPYNTTQLPLVVYQHFPRLGAASSLRYPHTHDPTWRRLSFESPVKSNLPAKLLYHQEIQESLEQLSWNMAEMMKNMAKQQKQIAKQAQQHGCNRCASNANCRCPAQDNVIFVQPAKVNLDRDV